MYGGKIQELTISTDELGFHLLIVADDIEIGFNLPDPEALYDQAKREIGPWLYERDTARGESGRLTEAGYEHPEFYSRPGSAFRCNPDESAGLRDLAVATAYDTAYEINDPKHPDYHSVHADHWDGREKC